MSAAARVLAMVRCPVWYREMSVAGIRGTSAWAGDLVISRGFHAHVWTLISAVPMLFSGGMGILYGQREILPSVPQGTACE